MNYNIIMLGTDLESIQNISTTLIDSTKLNNIISIFDIRKKYNNTKISTEYFSKSLFYEEIENSTDTNNIIIPDDILNFNINYIHDYIYFLPRTKFYLCIVKDSYPDYTNNFKKEMIYKRKYRIPKELTQQIVVDAVTYRSKIDNLLWDEKRFKYVNINKSDDSYNQIIKFTEFCVENNIDLIEEGN